MKTRFNAPQAIKNAQDLLIQTLALKEKIKIYKETQDWDKAEEAFRNFRDNMQTYGQGDARLEIEKKITTATNLFSSVGLDHSPSEIRMATLIFCQSEFSATSETLSDKETQVHLENFVACSSPVMQKNIEAQIRFNLIKKASEKKLMFKATCLSAGLNKSKTNKAWDALYTDMFGSVYKF